MIPTEGCGLAGAQMLPMETLIPQPITPEVLALVPSVQSCMEAVPDCGLELDEDWRLILRYARVHAMGEDEFIKISSCMAAMLRERESCLRTLDYLFKGAVADAVRRKIANLDQKHVKTPWGKLGFRKHKAKLVVVDSDALLTAMPHMKRVREVVEVDKAKLNMHYEATGEIPPGCDLELDSENFYVEYS